MGLFSNDPARVKVEASDVPPKAPPLSLWADSLGKLATRVLQVLLVLGIVVLAVIALRQITVVVIPVILALIFASAFYPAMAWMRRRGVPSPLATIITLLTIVILLGLVVWLIVSAVRNQWDELYTQGQEGFQELLAWVQSFGFVTDEQIENARAAVVDFITSSQFGTGALAGVSAVGNFAAGFVLLVTVLFFFLKDGPRLWEFMLRPFEGASYARGKRIGQKTVATLGSYTRGTALVAFVDAVGIGIGLLILQVPLAIPLTVLTFVLSFIPIVGAVLAGVLAALVALVSNGPINALFVIGVVLLVQQLESNILQPFLMGRTMQLNAFVILIALAAGAVLSGILGAILAVPITAVAWGIVQVWDGPDLPARWARRKRDEGDDTVRKKVADKSVIQPNESRGSQQGEPTKA